MAVKGANNDTEKVSKWHTNKKSEVEKKNSSSGEALAQTLKTEIIRNNPQHKPIEEAVVHAWARQADAMFRIDQRTPEDARVLLLWCQQDSFWKANILSMSTFREKYDQLTLKKQADKTPGERTRQTLDKGFGPEPKLPSSDETLNNLVAGMTRADLQERADLGNPAAKDWLRKNPAPAEPRSM